MIIAQKFYIFVLQSNNKKKNIMKNQIKIEMTEREQKIFKIHVKSGMQIMGWNEVEAIKNAEQKILNEREISKHLQEIGFTY
mgnify:CR=1 FL=1